ncbi:MAG TPA: hypothetical protein VIX62_13395 [Actinomycetota bacterium]
MSVQASDRRTAGALAIEPVVGWRVWRLQRVDSRLTLVSATRDNAWPAADAIEARCWIDHGTAGVPQAACRCGIYATSSPSALPQANVISPETCVVGAIAMWGSVVEHVRGARSQFAYPARLRLVCGRCLATGMGAIEPARAREWEGIITAVCDRHAGGFLTTRAATEVQQELLSTYAVDLLPIQRLQRGLIPVRDTRQQVRGAVRAVAAALFGGMNAWSTAWPVRPKGRDRRTGV